MNIISWSRQNPNLEVVFHESEVIPTVTEILEGVIKSHPDDEVGQAAAELDRYFERQMRFERDKPFIYFDHTIPDFMSVPQYLIEGNTDNEKKKSCTLKPNDLVIYDKDLKGFSTEVVYPQKYISWTDGKLVFRNDPPDVIARRLERWYNIDVEIKGSTSDDLRWRATFVDDNLEEVLKILKRSLHVDFKIESGSFNPDETIAKRKVILYLKNK